MKLHILSDLHLDFAPYRPMDDLPLKVDADVVVLAGDICNGPQGAQWVKAAFADKPVIYVAGNHEYYHGEMGEVARKIRAETSGSNVHFLENEEVVIDGVRFLGSTLWTDFEVEGIQWREVSMANARYNMNDFRVIQSAPSVPFTPLKSVELHRHALAWLQSKLAEPFPGETVVVTHHGCSRQSIDPKWHRNLLNGAFSSDLEHILGRCALWVHGHTHDNFDYVVEGTRVIVNPRGYCRSNFHETRSMNTPLIENCENRMFNPNLVVEI